MTMLFVYMHNLYTVIVPLLSLIICVGLIYDQETWEVSGQCPADCH